MIYLDTFHFPTEDEEFGFLFPKTGKNLLTCYATKYPFGLFTYRELPDAFEFGDITIFYGRIRGNGVFLHKRHSF